VKWKAWKFINRNEAYVSWIMQCINMWMDYGTMGFKEIKQELYNNAQNLGKCRGPLHQPWQQSSSTNYVWKQSLLILKCSHNRKVILRHSGNIITLQSYLEANLICVCKRVIYNKGNITNSLKFVLMETRKSSRLGIQHHGRSEE